MKRRKSVGSGYVNLCKTFVIAIAIVWNSRRRHGVIATLVYMGAMGIALHPNSVAASHVVNNRLVNFYAN
jgi:hypothetical protein